MQENSPAFIVEVGFFVEVGELSADCLAPWRPWPGEAKVGDFPHHAEIKAGRALSGGGYGGGKKKGLQVVSVSP